MKQYILKHCCLVMKYIILPVFIILILFYSIICLPHVIPNNIRANTLMKRLEQIPPPKGAVKLDEYTYFGTLYYPGSNPPCDVLVGIVYGIDDTDNTGQHYYGKHIQGIDKSIVLSVESVILRSEYRKNEIGQISGVDEYSTREIFPLMERLCDHVKNCFIVYVKDESYLKYDYRCPL